jgi:hypothetical protein
MESPDLMRVSICYTLIRMSKIMINVRITPEEHEILKRAAARAGRTKTDILRELKLAPKLPKMW